MFDTLSVWADTVTWQSLTTKSTIIRFQSQNDLERFNYNLDYGQGGGFLGLFSGSGGSDISTKLAKKVDDLVLRVQEILDMRKYMRKVQIDIYPNKEKLQEAYIREVGTSGEYRAWYMFNKHIIFLQSEDISAGMLAHELGHAVIGNYFQVRPPPATEEILARYIDAHLND